ncbi:MAG: hypothetical protein AAF844_01740 [Pseudomonadota bacterium]
MSKELENGGRGDGEMQDAAALLIPWYVNGTLEGEDLAAVERRIAEDAGFAAEVERERRMARAVAEIESADEATLESWTRLEARLSASGPGVEPMAPTGPKRAGVFAALVDRVQEAVASWPSLFASPYPAMGAAAVAVLAAVLLLQGPVPPAGEEPSFQTLTSDPAVTGPRLRVKAAETMDRAAFEALAADHGLDVVDGPSEGGVYTLAGADAEALQTAADAIAAAPGILFVTVRTE